MIPNGYTTVTPWIVSRDTARLLEFLAAAFDAEELARLEGPDGAIEHAEARIGDAVVLAGAEVVTVPTELAFGAMVARVRDPLGNVWWLQQQLADVSPEAYAARAAEPRFVEAMAYVQSAELVPR